MPDCFYTFQMSLNYVIQKAMRLKNAMQLSFLFW